MNKISYNSFVFVLSALVFFACAEQTEKEISNLVVPVKTEQAKKVKLVEPIVTSGRISSTKESKLSFKIPGIVKQINVKEGQSVKAGQALASLDLSEMEANLTKAKNGFEKARRDLERIERLHKDNVATLEQLQNTKTVFDVAKSDLKIAEFNYKYSTIKAPSDGTILMKVAEENELVNAGYPVIAFGSKSANWKIEASVADVEIVKISIGDSASVLFDAYPGVQFSAIVTEVGQAADQFTGTFEVALSLEQSTYKFASGFIGKIKIYPRKKSDVVLVPVQSVTQSNKSSGVIFIPLNDKVEKRIITTSGIYNNMVAVTQGLNGGETVITDGVEYLTENSQIKLVSVN